MFLPIVYDLTPFNDYMQQHQDEWVLNSRLIQATMDPSKPVDSTPYAFEPAVFDVVNQDMVPTDSSRNEGPFAPVWQWSPPPQQPPADLLPIGKENFGSLPHEAMLMRASKDTQGTFLSIVSESFARVLCCSRLTHCFHFALRLLFGAHETRL